MIEKNELLEHGRFCHSDCIVLSALYYFIKQNCIIIVDDAVCQQSYYIVYHVGERPYGVVEKGKYHTKCMITMVTIVITNKNQI